MKSKKLLPILLLIIYTSCFCQVLTEKEEDLKYKEDMTAIMQYTAEFRFGSDLQVGDLVEYREKTSEKKESTLSLEVTEKTAEGLWIVEKFDDNEVHMLFDPVTKKLKKIWGYDDRNEYQEFSIIQNRVIEARLPDIKQQIKENSFSDSIFTERKFEEVITEAGTFNCNSFIQSVNLGEATRDIPKSILEKMQHDSKLYFSEEVPKLFPLMHVSFLLIGRDDPLRGLDTGFVKNKTLELTKFREGDK